MTLGESTFKDFEINRKISEASARFAILLKDFTDRWDGLIDLYARDLERFAADFYAATDSFKA